MHPNGRKVRRVDHSGNWSRHYLRVSKRVYYSARVHRITVMEASDSSFHSLAQLHFQAYTSENTCPQLTLSSDKLCWDERWSCTLGYSKYL